MRAGGEGDRELKIDPRGPFPTGRELDLIRISETIGSASGLIHPSLAGRKGSSRMPSLSDWKVPPGAQPKPADYVYDLNAAMNAVVGLRSVVPEDAFTAQTLGTERAGNGVLIRDNGLV
jgi:hypothetical protein